MTRFFLFALLSCLVLCACDEKPLNDPYPEHKPSSNVYYSNFIRRPKTLDSARSYGVEEAVFTAQIYEPPLQYHYLKRPYQLIPLTTVALPKVTYLNKEGKVVSSQAKDIAFSIYDIHIKPGILYQPHPSLAKDEKGQFVYQQLTPQQAEQFKRLQDFKATGTREVVAADYAYQLKRLASPRVSSPILGFMSHHIHGLAEYAQHLEVINDTLGEKEFLDLRKYDFPGVEVINPYHYRIKINGKYPQFMNWLAMSFFAPMPWEADHFYQQPGMEKHNLSLDWYPIGSGPYMLTRNDPSREMILERNPNFREEYYPREGEPGDEIRGLLQLAGEKLPFVDSFVYKYERESIPRWNKFLQGYYDQSGIATDSFDEAIRINEKGEPELTAAIAGKQISLTTSIDPSVYFFGFNMLDSVVGGNSLRAKKLRQAIALAIDYQEFISIFMNGRGIPAHSLIPPGVFGQVEGEQGINTKVYQWTAQGPKRYSIGRARKLMEEAGYPGGIDPETGEALVINYEAVGGSGDDERARLRWLRKQFKKLGIELYVRATHYNLFQEKMRNGNAQTFSWGWSADYPDPENFLFLLYGPNSKVNAGGENGSNYANQEYDRLFEKMKGMDDGPERQQLIQQMTEIIAEEVPLVFGYHPKVYTLSHRWVKPRKPSGIVNNSLKYLKIDPEAREQARHVWNQPFWWPLVILVLIILWVLLPVMLHYWQKEHQPPKRVRKL